MFRSTERRFPVTYAARIYFLSLNFFFSIFCSSYRKYRSRIKAFRCLIMSKLMLECKAEGTNTPFYTANTFRSRKGSVGIHFPCSGGVTITLCGCRSRCFEGRRLQHPRPGFASNYALTWYFKLVWSFPQSDPLETKRICWLSCGLGWKIGLRGICLHNSFWEQE